MTQRVFNFNPGPAALPLAVLEQVKMEMLDFHGSGMSVLEISHRSKDFEAVIDSAVQRTGRLLGLDDGYHVLFIQGGASLQFAMVPMNLALAGRAVDYVNTGYWAARAIKEARALGKGVRVVATSEDAEFTFIPENVPVNADAAYLHLTSNNTIRGTQWKDFPDSKSVPLICDMSSDIFSRRFDPRPFGLIYAGAQKNIGPAGVTMVIVRNDMLERVPKDLPTMLKYTTYSENKSLHNTPPCFAIYVCELVLQWIEETVGGLESMERINDEKARILYDYIDSQQFYRGTARPGSRSRMNVTFLLPEAGLEKEFLDGAAQAGLVGLKGHRSVGGLRASLYNATTVEAVKALVDYMRHFVAKRG
ncbi:MAG TPA: 3-phosphoserine/phosphohydroxythreonine transaminase [Syntrophobacteraceae bacterium]|nr:3-phosphoserine/phosphohydroxythreonine transaminase [Syntrophobacteraceae bacterium]